MRKIISAIVSLSFLGLMIAPMVLAQVTPMPEITQCKMRHNFVNFTGFNCPNVNTNCPYNSTNWTCGACCLLDTIYTVTDWVFYIVLAFVIIFIMLGAFTIMTAGGAPEKVNTGRNYIIYAIVGLIVGLMAKMIPYIAKAIIGA
jgi:hypothetical protein